MKYLVILFGTLCLATQLKAQIPSQLLPPIRTTLDSIFIEDQRYRNYMDAVRQHFGGHSPEMKALVRQINNADSLHLIYVTHLLDKYGWPKKSEVGGRGQSTLFIVIQHSDLPHQQKYLPMFREAFKQQEFKGSSLALIEDRVAIGEGRKQIYGSQLSWDMAKNVYTLLPIDNPAEVDKRRAAMGMEPLAAYLEVFDMTWDAATHTAVPIKKTN